VTIVVVLVQKTMKLYAATMVLGEVAADKVHTRSGCTSPFPHVHLHVKLEKDNIRHGMVVDDARVVILEK